MDLLVNVPIGVVALVLAARLIPRVEPGPRPSTADLVGVGLLGGGVLALCSRWCWPRRAASPGCGGCSRWARRCSSVFVRWERRVVVARPAAAAGRRAAHRHPRLRLGHAARHRLLVGFSGIWLVFALYLQSGWASRPLQSGLAVTPFALGAAASAVVGGRLVSALRGRRLTVAGLILVVLGMSATAVILRVCTAERRWAGGWIAPLLHRGHRWRRGDRAQHEHDLPVCPWPWRARRAGPAARPTHRACDRTCRATRHLLRDARDEDGGQRRRAARIAELGPAREVLDAAAVTIEKLWEVFVGEDATLVEVNPLVRTPDDEILALDGKVTLDENADFRHPGHAEFEDKDATDPLEAKAKEHDLNYVKLDGAVGIIGNGAGLVMSTLDVVAYAGENHGGVKPANFLDIGGGASAEVMANGLDVILGDARSRACSSTCSAASPRATRWPTASSRRSRCSATSANKPLVVRLDGNKVEEGRAILARRQPPAGDARRDHGRRRRQGRRTRERIRTAETCRSSSTRTPRSSSRASPAARAPSTPR